MLIECKSASHSKDEAPYLVPACIHGECIEDMSSMMFSFPSNHHV